jgi:excisionase family DNA binding protein
MTEPWVSVDVLAQHLGVTKDSVYRWIERKGLPAQKIGRLWKFKVSEVDAWVRTGAAGARTHASQALDDSAK